MSTTSRCSVEGCTKSPRRRDLCGMHSARLRRHGSVGQPEPMHAVSWAGVTCSVSECASAVRSRGMCLAHYKRWKRWGDPRIKRPTTPAAERFWPRVNKDGPVSDYRPDLGRCWIWTAGQTPQGYGGFHPVKGGMLTAHRWAYLEAHGSIEPGLVVDHLCRERLCVNSEHLEAVTHLENLSRGKGYGLANGMRTTCINGHGYTPENTYVQPSNGKRRCRMCQYASDQKRIRTEQEEKV